MGGIIVIDNNSLNHSKYCALFSLYKPICYTVACDNFYNCKVLQDENILSLIDRIEKDNPILVMLRVNPDELKQKWFEFLKKIKTGNGTKRVPVVMLMPRDYESDDEKLCFEAYASDYIPVPFRDSVLFARVKLQIDAYVAKSNSLEDPLTNCHNRRFFDASYSVLWANARRDQKDISALMFDIDKFGTYNNTYGHQQGDIALKTVAQTLQETFKRESDIFVRYGGEEFTAILPDTDATTAYVLAEKARTAVENADISYRAEIHNIKVSVGVATVTPQDNIIAKEELIEMADNALFKAKDAGRNCTCVYSDEENFAGINIK
jgi:diguanylate cyclase (GGDEF)-like protein